MHRRFVTFAALIVAATATGLLAARHFVEAHRGPASTERAIVLAQPKPLPRLALVDERGRPFDGTAFRGHWTYVFFGFTSCPDVCPTTLTVVAQALRALQDLPRERQPQVLLVSVDPERDDPGHLASFVAFFDPGFHAATGSNAAVASAAAAFGAGYGRVALPGGGYTMDHTASLFLVGPDGALVATSGAPHDAPVLERDYRRITAVAGE